MLLVLVSLINVYLTPTLVRVIMSRQKIVLEEDLLRQLYSDGMSLRDIAKHLSVGYGTVHVHFKRYSIPRRGHTYWLGRTHSQETREKMSHIAKERYFRNPKGHSTLGFKHSKETKKRNVS